MLDRDLLGAADIDAGAGADANVVNMLTSHVHMASEFLI